MKITTILLLSACLSVSAGSLAQKVTLLQKNVKLEKVFKEIRKQTGYVFFYDTRILQRARSVDIHVENVPVEEALKESLRGQPLDFSIERKTITIFQKADYSLNKKPVNVEYPDMEMLTPLNIITGTVKDDKGQPLEGATILVKGAQIGTKSDVNGNFSITAEPNSTLIISYVGFESIEVNIGNRTNNISVQLKPSVVTGGEVVVVGYGTQSKRNITSSISSVSSKDISNYPVQQVGQALQGKVAGLQIIQNSGSPGSALTVRIRGIGTVNNSDPLYVIDGNLGANPSNLDPNNIETIEVLKSASAAAIYGAQGANGVILITTKTGVKGPAQINANLYSGIQQAHRFMPMMNAKQYATI